MANFFCRPLILALSMLCCAAAVLADDLEDCARLYNGSHRDQALAPCLRAEKSTRSAPIQFALGFIYERGYGVPVDQQKAFTWYMKAARQGHAMAQVSVGIAYQHGQGTAIDHVQARIWYLKAGAQDSEGAQFALGELYGKGLGVAADPHQAEQWFLKAANHHAPEMMRTVADHFLKGEMIERDPEKAAIWFKKAAVAGDAPAQLNFAMLLNRGLGVPVDKQAALGWFERAAQHYIGRKGLDPKTCTAECYPALRYFMLALEEAPASKDNRTKIARLDSMLSGKVPELTSPKKDGEPVSEKKPADEHDNLRKGTDWLKNRYWRSPWLVEPPPSVWLKSDPDIVVSGRSSLEIQPDPEANYQVEFDLSVVNFGKLANSDDGLQKKLQATADLLSSCGIRMRHVQITGVNVDNQAYDFVPGDLPSPNALAWVLPIALQDLRDADGVAAIDNLSSKEQPKVHIGEIDKENEPISASESLIVWPHELGHLLGEMGHPDDLRPSIMHYYALTDWSFTPEQCERMRNWPWMYRYRENASSVEWPPMLGTEEGQELILTIEGDANEGARLRSLQRLLLGKVTGETPDIAEEYAFASLIEHFYRAGLPRQGFYLELLWERRHGFAIADSMLDPVGFRPATLTREVVAQLRDVYMHTRPEQMLFDPEFWAGEPSADDPVSMPKPMVVASSDATLEGDRRQAVDLANPSNLALGAIGTVSTPSMAQAASGYLVSRCLVLTNKSAVFPSAHLARIKAQVSFRPAHASARSLAGRVVAYGRYAGKMYDANDNWALIRLDQTLPADAPVIPLYQMSMEQLKDRPLTAAGMLGATNKPYFDSQCKAEGLSVIRFTVAHHCQATTSQMGGPLLARGKDDRLYAIGMLTNDPWTAIDDADDFSHHQGINFIPGKIYELTTGGDRIIAQLKATSCGE